MKTLIIIFSLGLSFNTCAQSFFLDEKLYIQSLDTIMNSYQNKQYNNANLNANFYTKIRGLQYGPIFNSLFFVQGQLAPTEEMVDIYLTEYGFFEGLFYHFLMEIQTTEGRIFAIDYDRFSDKMDFIGIFDTAYVKDAFFNLYNIFRYQSSSSDYLFQTHYSKKGDFTVNGIILNFPSQIEISYNIVNLLRDLHQQNILDPK